jgi:anaerobic magnesium-protoporphyrin IX monomethyl ester cyclase
MRVLFTHSYFLQLDAKQFLSQTPFPPLALLYAAALLRKHNYEVKLADLQFASTAKEIEWHIQSFQPEVLVIYDDGFNYLTKMCLSNMREAAFEMQKIAKQYQLPIIVSSSDATDHIQLYFENGADYIIIGEAENSLLEIVTHIKNKTQDAIFSVQGIAYQKNKEVIKTPDRLVLKDLDSLPLPAWDLVDITPYKSAWIKKHGYFSLNFVTTRGCPYKCNWCAKPIYGNRYNSHSPEAIVQQIKYWQEQFGFTYVWFADDIFGLKPNWLKSFNEAVKKENLIIQYKIQSRADLLLESENIKYLAESGCKEVWMGAESGSQKILDAMDKGTTIEQIKTATTLLKAHQIKACYFLQFGYSGEYMVDIKNTLKLVTEMRPNDIGISVSYPLPGTKFYDTVKSQIGNKTNWKDSDDLDTLFQTTYSAQFYKLLQRYVHYQYRYTNAIETLSKNNILQHSKKVLSAIRYALKKSFIKVLLIKSEPDAKQLF